MSACATIRDTKTAGRLTPEAFSSSAIHHQLQIKKKMEACVWLCKNTVAFHLPRARVNSHRWALHRKKKPNIVDEIRHREKLETSSN